MGIERGVMISSLPTLAKSGITHFRDYTRRVDHREHALRANKEAALLLDGLTSCWGQQSPEEEAA